MKTINKQTSAVINSRSTYKFRPNISFVRMRNQRNTSDQKYRRGNEEAQQPWLHCYCTSSSEDCVAKRRMVLTRTVDKWITENDRTLNTTTWLTYERLNRECVHCLKCSVCIRFRDKLVTCINYSSAFIEGSKNLRSSAFKDHARSDMHQRAMLLLKKAH